MRTKNQQLRIILTGVIILSMSACSSFPDNDKVDPILIKQHESYLTLVEYHALKQVLMYEYYGLFSNNFQNTNLFEYEPTQKECMAYFAKIEQLLAYEEKITEAANVLQTANSQVLSSNDFLLKSAMAKWDWLLKYVPFKGKNIELRNKIVSMSKDFTDEQRKYLFDLLHSSPEWKGGAINETQFFSKMEKGELDNSILRIHNTFEEDGERGDYFTWAEQNKLLSAQLAYDYGKESLKTGEKVLVTTVENLNPAIGTSIKILDYGNKFLNYINECISGKTTEQFKEEVKQNIEAKYDESGLAQSETPQQQALSIVEQAQRLANVAQVNKNPASVVSDVSGWGGVKITNNDQSLIPDVVFAERLFDEIGANIILATKMLKNELNEWLVPLPEGDWDIVALDNKGRSDTIRDWSVITKNFGVADVSFVSNSNIDSGDDEDEDKDSEQTLPDSIQIALKTYRKVRLNLVDAGSPNYVEFWDITNDISGFDEPVAPISWNGDAFTCNFIVNRTRNSEITKFEVNISGTVSMKNDTLLISGTGLKKTWTYSASDNLLKYYSEISYSAKNLEYGPVKYFNVNNTFYKTINAKGNIALLDELVGLKCYYEKYNNTGEVIDKISYNKVSEIENMNAFTISFHK